MASRRRPARRSTKTTSGDHFMGIVIAIIFGLFVLVTLLQFAVAYPAFGVLLVLGVTMTVVLVVQTRSTRRRQVEAYEAQQRDLAMCRSMEIAPYHAMNAGQFERALALLCERDGCTNVQVVGGAGDLGADVIAAVPDGRRMVIQAKRFGPNTTVGSGDVQKVNGTYRDFHHAQLAVIVTTSRFTKPAQEAANRVGIRTYDQHALAGWASRTGPAPWH